MVITLITEMIKKNTCQNVALNIIQKERTRKGYFLYSLGEMCVSDTPAPGKIIAECIRS